MKLSQIVLLGSIIFQFNSFALLVEKPKSSEPNNIFNLSDSNQLFAETLNSNKKYEAFENDLEGEFGEGLSIDEEIANHEVNAVSVAIIEGDKIYQYHQYGYRDNAKTLPANENTTFHVASMSKFLAGIAMAEAERQGILDREKSIKSYSNDFPDSTLEKWIRKKFKNSEEDYPKSINIKRLMSHTAGLDRHGIGLMPMGLERTIKGILLGDLYDWNGVNPIHMPGTVYDYSGGGYVAAEHILELVTGDTFTDWVTKNVLDVVGLENATLETANDSMTNLARGCSRGICTGPVLRTAVKAAGGFISTAYDYAKILRLFMNDGYESEGDRRRVIKKSVIENVITATWHKDSSMQSCLVTSDCPQVQNFCVIPGLCVDIPFPENCYQNQCVKYTSDENGWRYGQGVTLGGRILSDGYHAVLTHGGSQEGYKTKFYVDRDKKVGIVILVAGDDWKKNGVNRGANVIKNEIFNAFERQYLED